MGENIIFKKATIIPLWMKPLRFQEGNSLGYSSVLVTLTPQMDFQEV